MLPIHKKLKLIAVGLSFSLIVGLAVYVTFARIPESWNLTKELDNFFYDIFFASSLTPHDSLVIIDSKVSTRDRSRSDYAAMIRHLCQAGAKCIALDIYFAGESNLDPKGDQELVNSVKDCPNVVLAIDFTGDQKVSPFQMNRLERLALHDSLCQEYRSPLLVETVQLPFDSLLSAAEHIGHINSIYNESYHFPFVLHYARKCFLSLPLQIAKLYYESDQHYTPPSKLSANGNKQNQESIENMFQLSDIPLDLDEQMIVNFIPLEKFRPYPYIWEDAFKLLQEQSNIFLNKVVLIVDTSQESDALTPIGPYPKWAILASLTSQLLQNSYIEASPVFYPTFFSAIIIFVGLIWFLFITPRLNPKWRKTRALFLTGNVIFILIIIILLRFAQQWIGVVVPLLMFNTGLLVARNTYYKMIKPPQYLDFDLAVLERKGQKYPIQVYQSPSGEDTSDVFFKSFIEEESFKDVFQKLKDWQASKQEIKWLGEKLFDALFQKDLYHLFINSLNLAKQEGKNLRLKLRFDSPELIRLPWELMYSSKLAPGFIALNKRLSLVRHIPLAQALSRSKIKVPLTILVAISNPKTLVSLDVEEEISLIRKNLRPLIWSGDVRLRFCENVTLEKLQNELERTPDILHYIGHSEFNDEENESYLIFESETEEYKKVDVDSLGTVLLESSIKLLVLNSCEGAVGSESDAFAGIAQNLVRVGLPAVVAMQFKVPDKTAIWFSKILYSRLLTNYSIDYAVNEVRRYIMAQTGSEHQDWATPVLFMRVHDGIIFDTR